jgi:WD40 repeat protein
MALFGSTPAAAASSTTGDTSKDVEVPQGQVPSDSISDLQFSPTNDFLAVGSWDKKVYIYDMFWVSDGQRYVCSACSKYKDKATDFNRMARA